MKRFYIKKVMDYITIVHRPSHKTIWIGDLPEGKEVVEKYINMNIEDFYKELYSLGIRFRTSNLNKVEVDKDKEYWYDGAWKYTTKQVLDGYNLEDNIPYEEIPLDFIIKLQNQDKLGWSINSQSNKKKPLKTKIGGKEEVKEVKKEPLKALPSKKEKAKVLPKKRVGYSKLEYKNQDEVRKAYKEKKITLEQYKSYMKTLRMV